MNFDDIYDILIQIFNLNIDFSIIFDRVKEPYRTEILNYIDYVKKNPIKSVIVEYNLSDYSKKVILEYINYILKKLDN